MRNSLQLAAALAVTMYALAAFAAQPAIIVDTSQPVLKINGFYAKLFHDLPLTSAYQPAAATIVSDRSGYDNPGTLTGTPPTAGATGVTLNGTTDYIVVPDTDDLSFGDGATDDPFTIVVWTNATDATKYMMYNKGLLNTDSEYAFYMDSSDRLSGWVSDESVANGFCGRYQSTGYAHEGSLKMLAMTYDGDAATNEHASVKLYIDAVRVDDTNQAGAGCPSYVAMENLTAPVWMGRYNVATWYAQGLFSYVRVYRKELSLLDLTELFGKGPLPGAEMIVDP